MRIIQCESKDEAVSVVASLMLEKIQALPTGVLGLATGKTMVPVYEKLVELIQQSHISTAKNFFFMLDEYLGLPENHPTSFKHYIKTHFLNPLLLSENQFCFPPVEFLDGASRYENALKESGGIDLQLLGLGQNGHIGFNEPGSEKSSRTRKVKLTEETIAANSDQFTDGAFPVEALSMGIGTILEAKNLLMLVTGKSKANAVKYLLNHHDDSSCPATFLKDHPHFTLVLDPEAASKINLNI